MAKNSGPGPGGGNAHIGHEATTSKSSSGMRRGSIPTGSKSGKRGTSKSGSGIDRMLKGRGTMPTPLGGFTQHPQTMFSGRNPRAVGK